MQIERFIIHLDIIESTIGPLSSVEKRIKSCFSTDNLSESFFVILQEKKPLALRYKIACGQEIVRAAKAAGIERLPAYICSHAPLELVALLDSITGVLPTNKEVNGDSDISLMIRDMNKNKKSLSQIATEYNIPRSTVYYHKRISDKLMPDVNELCKKGDLSLTSAYEISYEKPSKQMSLALRSVKEKWNKREIIAARSTNSKIYPVTKKIQSEADTFIENLSDETGIDFSIRMLSAQKGELIAVIYSMEELTCIMPALSETDKEITYNIDSLSTTDKGICRLTIVFMSLDSLSVLAEKFSSVD